jgi:nicotinate-nucleotide pyrophosphorylase (carboxylating)
MKPTLPADEIERLISVALLEDLGREGDITTDSVLREDHPARAIVLAKEAMVVCGLAVFRAVFLKVDPRVEFLQCRYEDGDEVPQGAVILEVKGSCKTLLKAERTALNILQRLSGIATLTRQFVEKAKPVTVLDTRKTTPGLRVFEKYAVKCGGGQNHRFGLFDAVLIKDNHIQAAGSITAAVKRVREKLAGKKMTVEVETTNLEEVDEALAVGVDIIMLDNMPLEMIRRAVGLIQGRARVEVSGSVSLERLGELARSGIDCVSVGALTHSPKSADISMNFVAPP